METDGWNIYCPGGFSNGTERKDAFFKSNPGVYAGNGSDGVLSFCCRRGGVLGSPACNGITEFIILCFAVLQQDLAEHRLSASSAYNVIVTYNPNYDNANKLNPVVKVYINNKSCTVINTTPNSTYSGMKENLMNTTSYIEDINRNKIFPINAQVCLMALIKEEFNPYVARCNSLILKTIKIKKKPVISRH